jgi:hypothetical protein
MNAQLILDYVKAILTSQVIAGTVALTFIFLFKKEIRDLLLRVATIKLPGGTEVSAHQSLRVEKGVTDDVESKPLPDDTNDVIRQAFEAERARASVWEYRYLNYFLVLPTQRVLDWLSKIQSPASFSLYDTVWIMAIPSVVERKAILEALAAHHLIQLEDELISITAKGRQYLGWRGQIP